GDRRVAVPRPRRAADLVPRRPRPGLARRKGVADHVRGHPRVRRPELVGADPVQPVGQAAAGGPARAAAHGGRERAIPSRGGANGERAHAADERAHAARVMTWPGTAGSLSTARPARFPRSLLILLIVSAVLRVAGLVSPGHFGD